MRYVEEDVLELVLPRGVGVVHNLDPPYLDRLERTADRLVDFPVGDLAFFRLKDTDVRQRARMRSVGRTQYTPVAPWHLEHFFSPSGGTVPHLTQRSTGTGIVAQENYVSIYTQWQVGHETESYVSLERLLLDAMSC